MRSQTSLIQTIGRAARNVSGEVHMYADKVTDSMRLAIDETDRRRARQIEYNELHGIDPQPLRKRIADITETLAREAYDTEAMTGGVAADDDIEVVIAKLTDQMMLAAQELKFELAARLRDEVQELKRTLAQSKSLGKP